MKSLSRIDRFHFDDAALASPHGICGMHSESAITRSTRPSRNNRALTDGRQDKLQPNTCGPSSGTGRSPASPRPSIDTDSPSRFAMSMAETSVMVTDGHAWAFVRYSRDYLDEEREAAAVRAGLHGHICEHAWRWRAEQR
jgi:hypothetical protein